MSIFNSLPQSITNLKNEKTEFKVALKKFLNAHSFYSVDELFTCTNDMYCWLYDCANVSYTVIFLLFVCLWHVPHPIVLWLSRIYGMYICMCVCDCHCKQSYSIPQIVALLLWPSVYNLQGIPLPKRLPSNPCTRVNNKVRELATICFLFILEGLFIMNLYQLDSQPSLLLGSTEKVAWKS